MYPSTDQASHPIANGDAPYLKLIEAMRPLAGKWKIEILWILAQRRHRFGELRRSLPGITQHMLTLRLREMEADGLISRTVYPENVLRVEYEVSEGAQHLKPAFRALVDWSEQYGPLAKQREADAVGETTPVVRALPGIAA